MKFCLSAFNATQLKKISDGIDKYLQIMELLRTKGALNPDFQRAFNGFFRVRRNSTWQADYYGLLDNIIKTGQSHSVNFDYVYDELLKLTGSHEPSFSSKMLHVLQPDKPILDKNVLKALGFARCKDHKSTYRTIQQIYRTELIHAAEMQEYFDEFDKTFPNGTGLSDVKKIDFFLWVTTDVLFSFRKIVC